MNIIDYIVEEVERQGHDTFTVDGLERVGWMFNAWVYALRRSYGDPRPLDIDDILNIGSRVEAVKNYGGFRSGGVRVGARICPRPEQVVPLLTQLFLEHNEKPLKPLDFYRRLLEIHPFVDGNGRTGKVVLAWLSGKLKDPGFPPKDFWGAPIRNP